MNYCGCLNSSLNNKINIKDVVDSLESTETEKPLSANQGRVLKGHTDNVYSINKPYYMETSFGDVSVGSKKEIGTFELPSGLWYVTYSVRWESQITSGTRTISVTTESDSIPDRRMFAHPNIRIVNTINGFNDAYTVQVVSGLMEITGNPIRICIQQTSGNELNTAYNLVCAYRLNAEIAD